MFSFRSSIAVFLAACLFSLSGFSSNHGMTSAQNVSAIKGFHDWKIDKIQIAQAQTNVARNLLLKAKSEGLKSNIDTLDREINQLQWNLDITKDLSVADYVVLYLSHLNQGDRFQQAAAKLGTPEVAELMEAYANSLGTSSNPADLVTLRTSPAASLQKLPVQATGHSREPIK